MVHFIPEDNAVGNIRVNTFVSRGISLERAAPH